MNPNLLRRRDKFDDNLPGHARRGRAKFFEFGNGLKRGLIEFRIAGGIHELVAHEFSLLVHLKLEDYREGKVFGQVGRLFIQSLNLTRHKVEVARKFFSLPAPAREGIPKLGQLDRLWRGFHGGRRGDVLGRSRDGRSDRPGGGLGG